jgi:hypothetical protein
MREVAHEFRADLKRGAMWADAHLVSVDQARGLATVTIDSSLGFDPKRHPQRKKTKAKHTTVFVEMRKAS